MCEAANQVRPYDPRNAKEITPAMIEAHVTRLAELQGQAGSAYVVEEIYRAMCLASERRPSVERKKLASLQTCQVEPFAQ